MESSLRQNIHTRSHIITNPYHSPQRPVQRGRVIDWVARLVQAHRQILVLQRHRHPVPGAPDARLQHATACGGQVRAAGRRRGTRRRRSGRGRRRHGGAHMTGFHHVS